MRSGSSPEEVWCAAAHHLGPAILFCTHPYRLFQYDSCGCLDLRVPVSRLRHALPHLLEESRVDLGALLRALERQGCFASRERSLTSASDELYLRTVAFFVFLVPPSPGGSRGRSGLSFSFRSLCFGPDPGRGGLNLNFYFDLKYSRVSIGRSVVFGIWLGKSRCLRILCRARRKGPIPFGCLSSASDPGAGRRPG